MGELWHIFNGDFAQQAWQSLQRPGRTLVWRENYLVGRPGAPFAERADMLQPLAPEHDRIAIIHALEEQERQRRQLATPEHTLLFWFDYCPFDQSMLAILLALFRRSAPANRPRLTWIVRDVNWGDAAEFQRYPITEAQVITETQWREGAACGEALWRGHAALADFLAEKKLAALPVMDTALRRWLAENPPCQ